MSANGYLTPAELSPLAGGYFAAKGPAAAWNAFAAEVRQAEGVEVRVNGPDSGYRTFARQVFWKNYWCGQGHCENAATPGTSNHGLGWAFDVPDFVGALLDKYGSKYGFRRACSDAPWENWHWKWCGGWTGTDPGPAGHPANPYPTLSEGDNNTEAIKRLQKHLRRWNLGLTRPKVDGGYGPTTKQAVKDFQAVRGMPVDGVCGSKTWAALRRKDHFLDDERSNINRIRLMLIDGVSPGETPRVKARREFCDKRAKSIKVAAAQTGWDQQHRRERYAILSKLA